MAEKRPGHENLLAAANAVLEVELDKLTEGQKKELVDELTDQAYARRDDIIPEDVKYDVVRAVVGATGRLTNRIPLVIWELAVSNVGLDGFKQILDSLPGPWVIFRGTLPGGTPEDIATTRERYEQLLVELEEMREDFGAQVVLAMNRALQQKGGGWIKSGVPTIELIWPVETSSEGGTTASGHVIDPFVNADEEPATTPDDLRRVAAEPTPIEIASSGAWTAGDEPEVEVIPVVTDGEGDGETKSVPRPGFKNEEDDS